MMLKDSTYSQKLTILKKWIPNIVEEIKRDLKNDHLKKDKQFCKTYFSTCDVARISTDDLSAGYRKAAENEAVEENLAEFIGNRWLLKNTDIYDFYEFHLSKIDENFTELEVLEPEAAEKLVNASVHEFGPVKSYIFSVLNSVVFPETHFKKMEKLAEDQNKNVDGTKEKKAECSESDKNYERQIARLTDKYEKRLAGLENKYNKDVDALKKQIVLLQKKIS